MLAGSQREGLEEYANNMRKALESIARRPVDERGWGQAQLGIVEGGLGLRDPRRHAPAAYLASTRGTRGKCCALRAAYGTTGFKEARAEAELLEETGTEASLVGPAGKGAQKYLSGLVDARVRQRLESGPGSDGAYKQHLALMRQPSAGVWLTAPPVDDGRHMDPDLFRIALARRLRLKLSDKPQWCPFCCEILDPYGDHALTCACKGDRTVRHNKFRNIVWEESRTAGLDTEKEKANLLPERPSQDEIRCSSGRRPADIFWKGGEPIGGSQGSR